jgi:hypothetical protein
VLLKLTNKPRGITAGEMTEFFSSQNKIISKKFFLK